MYLCLVKTSCSTAFVWCAHAYFRVVILPRLIKQKLLANQLNIDLLWLEIICVLGFFVLCVCYYFLGPFLPVVSLNICPGI